jgi:hypothetical protein
MALKAEQPLVAAPSEVEVEAPPCRCSAEVARLLLDCLLLLCQSRPLREELRRRQVYPVIRNLHLAVTAAGEGEMTSLDDPICEIVDFLMDDEE